MANRKVLRVSNSEFLLRVYPDKIETINHIKNAMDLNELDWGTIGQITQKLSELGYKISIIDYESKGRSGENE